VDGSEPVMPTLRHINNCCKLVKLPIDDGMVPTRLLALVKLAHWDSLQNALPDPSLLRQILVTVHHATVTPNHELTSVEISQLVLLVHDHPAVEV